MAGSSMRSILAKIDPRPANTDTPRSLELTADDLLANVEDARERVERARGELERRLAEYRDAERALVERVGPTLTHHVIVAREQEEEAGE